ncbi:hypothetical protein FM125_11595 [Micrococcus lylae]|uniref:Uncharacterized protein n=1 Tax=Micrococcus lylae TaxID=1273 RepID=A0A1R4JZH9_9MICC|nr:hypothetical protein FM125_11595 [Micrococcus lylae]
MSLLGCGSDLQKSSQHLCADTAMGSAGLRAGAASASEGSPGGRPRDARERVRQGCDEDHQAPGMKSPGVGLYCTTLEHESR